MDCDAVSLNGKWTLCGRPERIGRRPEVFHDGEIVIPDAAVPGNIELELCRAGFAPEPYFGTNSNAYRAFESYEWCLERTFELADADGEFELEFAGIDCFGTVFLNGEEIGGSHNALIPARFPTGGRLRAGRNSIAVHIAGAVNAFRREPLVPFAGNISPFGLEQTRVRKPAHVWGWDIAPRLALGGIFRDVTLRKLKPERIVDWAAVLCKCSPDEAWLRFHCKFETAAPGFDDLLVAVEGACGDSRWHAEQRPWSSQQVLCVKVPRPRLWWPKHYGKAELYDVKISLCARDGRILDEVSFRYGIRSVRLKCEPVATGGTEPDFQFIVNGVPIRTWGLNHVPCDALHSRDRERMPEILRLAAEADLNILRIWGGGIPEDDAFYDFCDREGILVWHDFMYGCALYPDDEAFLREAEREGIEILRARRHHACIALWVGDNECDMIPFGTCNPFTDPAKNKLTRRLLPELCRLYAPGTPYLPSSPYISPECLERSLADGAADPTRLAPEQHLWGSHEYFKSDFYKTGASFISETGYHASPCVSTLKEFLPPEKLWPWDNDDWYHHASNPFMPNKDYNYRIRIVADQIRDFFGEVPTCVEDFALASQIVQAEANHYFIGSARMKRKISGLILWNLIDCWPHFSDSIVDYCFRRKLSYYYCRRDFRDFVINVGEAADWHWPLVASNDSNQPKNGVCRVWRCGGDTVAEGEFSLAPGEIRPLPRLSCSCTEQTLLLLEWRLSDGSRGVNHKVTGSPRYDFNRFRREWLPAIAALDHSFPAEEIGR